MGEEENAALHEVGRLATYKETPYVTLTISKVKMNMKVPNEVMEELNQ